MTQRRATMAALLVGMAAAWGCVPVEEAAPEVGSQQQAAGLPPEECAVNPASLVKALYPPAPAGSSPVAGLRPQALLSAGGKLFFTAPPEAGGGVWVSDGTAQGTQLLHARTVEPFDSAGLIFFFEDRSLWRTDGTPAGTVRLGDFSADPAFVSLQRKVTLSHVLFFEGQTQYGKASLWRSDGTERGTRNLGIFGALGDLTSLGGVLYFAAGPDAAHLSLWSSLDAIHNTLRVTEVLPGGVALRGLHVFGNKLLFVAGGRTLWQSDGTAAGTVPVLDFPSGATVQQVLPADGRTYLVLDEGAAGLSLWRTDGTAAGTARVKDGLAGFEHPFTVGSKLFFEVPKPGAALELWASNGAEADTQPVLAYTSDRPRASSVSLATRLGANGLYYFVLTTEAGTTPLAMQLWRSDGTPAGTFPLVEPLLSELEAGAPKLVAVNRRVIFSAGDPDGTAPEQRRGQELWQTDGSTQGTYLIQDVVSGAASSYPHGLVIAGAKLYFAAKGEDTGFGLWALPVPCLPAPKAPPLAPSTPGITCPGNLRVDAQGPEGANVSYPPALTSGGAPAAYDIPSGSRFPVGETTVTAFTTSGPQAQCTFKVTVNAVATPPPATTCAAMPGELACILLVACAPALLWRRRVSVARVLVRR